MSVIAAAQITAVGTGGVALFAIITAWYARKAFRGQSQEVGLLQQQLDDQRQINARQAEVAELQAQELRDSLDERKRDAAARKRAQASRVFLSEYRSDPRAEIKHPASDGIVVQAENTSEQPIYDVEFRWHRGSAPWGEPDCFRQMLPGERRDSNRMLPADLPDYVDRSVFGAVLRFRDASGVLWLRRPGGELNELAEQTS